MATSAIPPSKEQARRELARRRLAQRDLLYYGQYMMPSFREYPHQRILAEKLAGVEQYVASKGASGIGNLMVMMPPQHGKSTTVAQLFPSFGMGRHPDWPWITTSYNDQKATGNSRAVRELVDSKNYRKLFGDLSGNTMQPVELSSDTRSVSEWRLAGAAGGMVAAGVGGGVTGYPSKVTIIDDPFKNRDEADSEDRQEKVWDWYETSILTRRQVGSAIILFHTRWNVRDLAGRLIQQMVTNPKADQWDIVFLPALALQLEEAPRNVAEQRARMAEEGVYIPMTDQIGRQPGQALCPDMAPQAMLENIRDNMSLYNWASMFQQMPTTRGGNRFKRDWFKVETVAADLKFVRALWYWDKAASAGHGDYSVGVLLALDNKGRVWVLDVARGQWSTYERDRQMGKAWHRVRERFGEQLPVAAVWHQQDPGGAGLDSARATSRALAPIPSHFEPVTGDKETRADPWSSALEADNVRLAAGGWNQAFIDEHLVFPKGRNDDQVDAASSCYARLMLKGVQREAKSYAG